MWISDIHTCGVNLYWRNILDGHLPKTETYDPELQDIVKNLRTGEQLTHEQGVRLWNYPNLSLVASLADACKKARFGEQVFFNSNLHVNQTNICTLACKF